MVFICGRIDFHLEQCPYLSAHRPVEPADVARVTADTVNTVSHQLMVVMAYTLDHMIEVGTGRPHRTLT